MPSTVCFLGSAAALGPVVAADELGYLALGAVFCAIGLITLLLTILRTASRDASIFLFGIMSLLWGLRFVLYTHALPVLWGWNAAVLDRIARGCTYFSAAAVFAFACAYLGPGWRATLRWTARTALAFAVVAGFVLALDPNRDLLLPAFSIMVLAGVIVVVGNAAHPGLRDQLLRDGVFLGVALSAVFFLLENLRALGAVSLPFDVEWIGVLVLYVTLGRLIAVRMFTNERRLAALQQELETARRIQASLLPQADPRIAELAVAARYEPMTEVAGDIYDYVETGRRQLAVLVADVSGHGVPAALIASMVKGAFRAQADRLDRPDRVLTGMNRILTGQLETAFVTAGCAFIDLEGGVLRHASAGHPPLLVRRGDAAAYAEASAGGLILGQFPDAPYAFSEHEIGPGDRLVMYTDGLIEAENAAEEQFGDASFLAYLQQNHRASAAVLADGLIDSVRRWHGAGTDHLQDDDVTVIVVDVLGAARSG